MKLKSFSKWEGFDAEYPWGVELPFRILAKRYDLCDWLDDQNMVYHYSNYEFWFTQEIDRTTFVLTWG